MTARIDLALCTRCHCLAARRNSRALTRLYEAKLRPHGLRATLTRGAALLERNGWVKIRRSQDGRERHLRLTGAGRRKLASAYPAWKTAQDTVDKKPRGLPLGPTNR